MGLARVEHSPTSAGRRRKVHTRAGTLKDAALELRDVVNGYHPGAVVPIVQMGAFIMRFEVRTGADGARDRLAGQAARNALQISTHGAGKLLEMSWDSSGKSLVDNFARGPWEGEFLRLVRLAKR